MAAVSRGACRVLNVAEKNDAAKRIAELLSRGQMARREGRSRYNKIYEFDYHLLGRQCTMAFTSVTGHVMNLDFDPQYRNWESTPISQLFEAPVHKGWLNEMQPVVRTLQEEARLATMLIIWTDCDREGENIGYEVVDVCRRVNPNLNILRAVFSEITRPAVTRALNSLVQPNKRLVDAVDCRMEMDLRTGAAFTRFQTLRLRNVFRDHLKDKLVSYGSCQFPTLGFVVDRYKQNKNFIREPFWKLTAIDGRNPKGPPQEVTRFNWRRVRLFDKHACEVLLAVCQQEPRVAKVLSATGKSTKKYRPLPLDTVEMEKLANRKLKISAKETMAIAEKLYTQGYISYPRTETNMFAKEIKLAELVQLQTTDSQWGEFASRILAQGPNPRNGTKNDQAHPPIHPIRYAAPQELTGDHRKLYEFIVRHFLACLSQDAEAYQTTVDIDVHEERFYAIGLMVTARNYLEVYPYETWATKEICEYKLGETFPVVVEMSEGETSPPALLTEADLIALMDKFGIGTDATHAEHIETIKRRLYVGLNSEARFLPGFLGLGLVEGYDAIGCQMAKPSLRAEFEADLKRICDGLASKEDVLQRYIQKYKEVYETVVGAAGQLDTALSAYFGSGQPPPAPSTTADVVSADQQCSTCSSCKAPMTLKTARGGKMFLGCSAFPNCKEAVWIERCDLIDRYTVTSEQCNRCIGRQSRLVEFGFKANTVGLPASAKTCLTCASEITSALGIKPPGVRVPFRPAQAPHSGAAFGNAATAVVCNCRLECSMFTVRKEGPNKGRQFYVCPKAQSDQSRCRFFIWADVGTSGEMVAESGPYTAGRVSIPRPRSTYGGSGGGGVQQTFFPASVRPSGGPVSRRRKCSICRQEGHTMKKCPQRVIP